MFLCLFILFLLESVYFFPLKSKNHRVGGNVCIVLYIVPVQDERKWAAELEGEPNELRVRTVGGGGKGCIVLHSVPVQDEREWEAELEGELNEYELVEEERAV